VPPNVGRIAAKEIWHAGLHSTCNRCLTGSSSLAIHRGVLTERLPWLWHTSVRAAISDRSEPPPACHARVPVDHAGDRDSVITCPRGNDNLVEEDPAAWLGEAPVEDVAKAWCQGRRHARRSCHPRLLEVRPLMDQDALTVILGIAEDRVGWASLEYIHPLPCERNTLVHGQLYGDNSRRLRARATGAAHGQAIGRAGVSVTSTGTLQKNATDPGPVRRWTG